MVKWWTLTIGIIGIASATAVQAASSVDIIATARSWGPQFVLSGTKTEPTYIEHIRLERDGNLFVLEGGAPAGMLPSRESLIIEPDGTLRHLECPPGMRCDRTEPPSGFLASALIVTAIRHGRLSGFFRVFSYGSLRLVCIAADRLGVHDAILDPCVEIHSGAVVAQRHRLSEQFDGPSLDPWSVSLSRQASFSSSSR